MASGTAGSEPPASKSDQSPATKRRREKRSPPSRDALIVPSVESASEPRRGSASSSKTMQRSPSPGESSGYVKLTKTGRVSKAAKGQRVHRCDECGKVYTRAEHLRRHRQNHQPGSFPCDIPGCRRTFNREDLLVRHKVRHDDPLNQPSRRASFASQGSPGPPPSTVIPMAPYTASASGSSSTIPTSISRSPGPGTARAYTEQRQSPERGGRRKGYIPIQELRPPADCAIESGNYNAGPYLTNASWRLSTPQSSDNEYDMPSTYGQPGLQLYTSSGSSFPNTNLSVSPVSPAGNTSYWAANPVQLSTPSSDNSFGILNGSQHQVFEEQTWPPVMSRQSPRNHDTMEQQLLAFSVTSIGSQQALLPHHAHEQRRYLTAFWDSVHPVWPIVHRPTFERTPGSPLLRAAMMALGASASDSHADASSARDLHGRCLKILDQRAHEQAYAFRICDMQAIFLVELYTAFRSRRPPSQLSQVFEGVYAHLAQDTDANPAVMVVVTDPRLGGYDPHEGTTYTLDQQCAQRLLAACHILDREHTMLFGRAPCSAAANITTSLLPCPVARDEWDGDVGLDNYGFPTTTPSVSPHQSVGSALQAASLPYNSSSGHTDLFCAMLLGMHRIESELDLFVTVPSHSPNDHAEARVSYHTFAMCAYTPVRDLLAVAGESWVMSKKLPNKSDYIASQFEIRDWSSASSNVEVVVFQALEVVKLHRQHPKTTLLFHEWSLCLAVLVLWACAYSATGATHDSRRPRISVPSPSEPRRDRQELERVIDAVVREGTQRTIGLREVRDVLLWAKGKLESEDGYRSGLVSSAVDVLKVLCRRGGEEGWF